MINEYQNKSFLTRDELFKFLRDNKSALKTLKKAALKLADGVNYLNVIPDLEKKTAVKDETIPVILAATGNYNVKVVINACNFLDSHMDVHIAGLWKKSINELKSGLHLQEHAMKLEKVISDNVKVFTSSVTWNELGYSYTGSTECLIHDTIAEVKRNPFMADQYSNGWVSQHSVGMRYVNLFLCLNSDYKFDKEEKDNWDKYYPYIVNKEVADEYGFFWAVTEAKYVEGSAVVRGSNPATPMQDFQFIEEPGKSTPEPEKSTLNLEKMAELISKMV